jgi:23S rRNA (cytosine1962-C5)-methyltransferase
VLNTFAYTCAFSVCAARVGARATSLDVSKKYLEWGRRNFALNGLAPEPHDFVYGDVFDWLKRWGKKGRKFQLVILDPPTFSRTRERGEFRARSDYGALVKAALPVLARPGVLLASTNAAGWPAEDFVETVTAAVHAAQGNILRQHFCPAPPDFPITREEPPSFKSVWLQVG